MPFFNHSTPIRIQGNVFLRIAVHDGPVELRTERDLDWIKAALGDTARSENDRAMLLQVAMRLTPRGKQSRDHVLGLKPLVRDQASLLAAIEGLA